MTSPKGSPVAASERAVSLDAVRGVALSGVLTVNLVTEFRVSLFQQFLPRDGASPGSAADQTVASIVRIGLESKALILFSLLFGVGLAAQHERIKARGGAFAPYVARRLAMLLVIGVAHLFLIWNGDILTLYAVIGILAAPLLGLSTRVLLGLALGLFVLQVLPLPYTSPFESLEAMAAHVEAARHIYGGGSFGQVLAFRVQEIRPISALQVWSAPRTLGLFLLGACTWRWGLFLPGQRRAPLVATAVLGLGLGTAAAWTVDIPLGGWRDVVFAWGAIALALGYGAAIVVAFGAPRIARVLSLFAPLGRMALTSYLTQSVVLSVLFYGWGLGLFGRLGEASAFAIGVALFVAQAVFSALWLKRYAFGPVEWLWRSFTYGAWQPMRR